MRKSVKDFVVEYGAIGLIVYLTSTALVYVGFWLALRFGWRPSGTVGNAGYWITAYAAAKVTQPFRIIGSAAVTPIVARIYEKITGKSAGTGKRRDVGGGTSQTPHANPANPGE